MIITRSPLRLSLGGGGTDLPSYYRAHGGFAVAAAIDKYVYIALHQTFVPELIVKYSQMERVSDASQVRHPIIREAFRLEQQQLPAGLDLVVRPQKGAIPELDAIRRSLPALARRIARRLNSDSRTAIGGRKPPEAT